MGEPLNVLIVEDSHDDTTLLLHQLRRGGYEPNHVQVDNEPDLIAALNQQPWDLVLSDYKMPGYDGMAAFDAVKRMRPELPYIFVSGHIGEERAVAAMKRGANDYVLKENLARLVPAIERELRDAKVRRERIAMEQAFHDSELRANVLLANVMDLILVISPAGVLQTFSDSVQTELGYSAGELTGRNIYSFMHPDDIAQARTVLSQTMGTLGLQNKAELRVQHRDGTWRILSIKAKNLCDVPLIQGILINARDVTERRRAEKALAENERLLRTVFETLPHPLVVKDRDARYLMVNKAWCRNTGIPEADALRRHVRELKGRPDDVIESILAEDEQVLSGNGEVRTFQHTDMDREGRLRNWQVIRAPLLDEQGRVSGVVGISVDITAELEAHRQADLAFGRLYDAIESQPTGFLLFDQEHRLVMWNSSMRGLYPELTERLRNNLSFDEWIQAEAACLDGGAEVRERWLQAQQDASADETNEGVVRLRDGRWIETRSYVTTEGGLVCVRMDVTGEKQREQELRQTQKMETLGQFTSGVAHDFNNLLQVIQGYCELGLGQVAAGTSIERHLQSALTATSKAANLTRQLLAFSRKQELHASVTQLPDILRTCTAMLGRMLPENITLVDEVPDDLSPVCADEGMLEQVVMNLVINARDAMPDGGMITLRCTETLLTAADCQAAPWAKPGPHVTLICSDQGEGMSPEVMEHIFDPFFTTKRPGKGTGLGLSTVYGIVQQHQGLIQVSSRPGAGTTFTLHLPAAEAVPANQASTAQPTQATGPGTVLVVEDEDAVLELTRVLLSESGLHVLTAGNGQEALDRMREHGKRIDLVLTDCIMPVKGGLEASLEIRQEYPDLPIVLMSGWQDSVDAPRMKELGLTLLEKPFQAEELLNVVHERLRASRATDARN